MMIFIFITALFGCDNEESTEPVKDKDATNVEDHQLVGSDRDSHGCIGSAGYSWCAKTNQCERPWELAQKHRFNNKQKTFDQFYNNPV